MLILAMSFTLILAFDIVDGIEVGGGGVGGGSGGDFSSESIGISSNSPLMKKNTFLETSQGTTTIRAAKIITGDTKTPTSSHSHQIEGRTGNIIDSSSSSVYRNSHSHSHDASHSNSNDGSNSGTMDNSTTTSKVSRGPAVVVVCTYSVKTVELFNKYQLPIFLLANVSTSVALSICFCLHW
jgi:hypothetical protein